jgi:hypothetical protein
MAMRSIPPAVRRGQCACKFDFLFPKFTKEQEKMMMEMKLKQLEQEQKQAPPKK